MPLIYSLNSGSKYSNGIKTAPLKGQEKCHRVFKSEFMLISQSSKGLSAETGRLILCVFLSLTFLFCFVLALTQDVFC